MSPVDELRSLFDSDVATRGYADGVHQLDHALQCAALAEQAGADDALVAASLLHDVGHLLGAGTLTSGPAPAEDLRHEHVGGRYLRRWFGPEVTAPVVLHVAAKRYLCTVDDEYLGLLSPGSVHSLGLQGGPMTGDECRAFETRQRWEAATSLRRWDDAAKVPGARGAPIDHYLPLLTELLIS